MSEVTYEEALHATMVAANDLVLELKKASTNKAAARRARKITSSFAGKLGKEFRKLSVANDKKK